MPSSQSSLVSRLPPAGRRRPNRPAPVWHRVSALVGAAALALAGSLGAEPVATPAQASPQREDGPRSAPAAGLEQLAAQVQTQRLVLALQQLVLISRTHQPFGRELELVQQLGGRKDPRLAPSLDILAQRAETGVATASELRDSFGLILLPKLQALQTSGDGPWLDRFRTWLSSAISPTPSAVPPDAEGGAQQLIATAMDRLSEDDLRAAMELVGRLTGAPASLTSRWLTEAKGRVAVDGASESIATHILELLRL